MGKLIRAELFRTRKINGFWVFTFFISLYMMVLPFVTVKADSAMTFFQGTLEGMAVAAMLIAMMPAYIMGRGYYHRTCMYEVMAGNSPFRIIFSKLISIALLISLIVFVSHLVGLGIASAMNSEGIVDVIAKDVSSDGASFFHVWRSDHHVCEKSAWTGTGLCPDNGGVYRHDHCLCGYGNGPYGGRRRSCGQQYDQ